MWARWFRNRLQQQQLHFARVHSCHGILYLHKQYKIESKKKWSNIKREMTANKTSPASIPPAKKIKKRKKITTKIYHLTKSIYSSVVRNSFSCAIVLLAVVWSPELGLYIFLFGWCVCWFVFLSCWSVSGRFRSGRKRGGGLTRVENRKQVWVGLKTGGRLYRCSYAPLW